MENLALIPGTVGAAPIQNIGAYGVEVERFIAAVHYVDLLDGQRHTLPNAACKFGYRDSIFKHELKNKAFITQVDFLMPKQWCPVSNYSPLDTLTEPTATEIFELVCHTRQSKLPDPKVLGNAGSFFKNPVVSHEEAERLKSKFAQIPNYPVDQQSTKLAAGWLIDQVGLKGFEYKNVAVHEAQARVWVNKTGKATGEELLDLIKIIRDKIFEQFNVKLETEVRLIGTHGEINIEVD